MHLVVSRLVCPSFLPTSNAADIIIIIIIYLLNKAIEKKKCSNMYSRAGQQSKGTDSCPEIRELHVDKQKLKSCTLLNF